MVSTPVCNYCEMVRNKSGRVIKNICVYVFLNTLFVVILADAILSNENGFKNNNKYFLFAPRSLRASTKYNNSAVPDSVGNLTTRRNMLILKNTTCVIGHCPQNIRNIKQILIPKDVLKSLFNGKPLKVRSNSRLSHNRSSNHKHQKKVARLTTINITTSKEAEILSSFSTTTLFGVTPQSHQKNDMVTEMTTLPKTKSAQIYDLSTTYLRNGASSTESSTTARSHNLKYSMKKKSENNKMVMTDDVFEKLPGDMSNYQKPAHFIRNNIKNNVAVTTSWYPKYIYSSNNIYYPTPHHVHIRR